MQPSFTILLHKCDIHWVPISPVACIISATNPDNLGLCVFIFFNAAATSLILMQSAGVSFNSSRYSMIPLILFIHQLFHVFLPWIFNPFLIYNHFNRYSFQTVWPCYILSFTICFAIQKISFWWLGSFKSLANSFCFFPFAKEITHFAFCLLFLHSFHASVDFSFFQFPYFFFFTLTASATSSFHYHVSLCHGPFDNPDVTCAVCIIILFICYCLQCFDAVGWASGRASGL